MCGYSYLPGGASTLAELNYYCLPSILIPLSKEGGGHQKCNALYFENKGAALVFSQDRFSFPEFSRAVKKLLYDGQARQRLRDNLRAIRLGVSFEEFSRTYYPKSSK